MLPLLIPLLMMAPLASVAGYLGYGLATDPCPCCKKRFRKGSGKMCNGDISEHGQKYIACSVCSVEVDIAEFEGGKIAPAGYCRLDRIQDREDYISRAILWTRVKKVKVEADKVDVYPNTYKGRLPAPKLLKQIKSGWYYSKEDANLVLQALAVFDGCYLVQKVEYHKHGDGGYWYVQTLWQASGVI
jgi:hypothetical protein